jgi:hypothetical protein
MRLKSRGTLSYLASDFEPMDWLRFIAYFPNNAIVLRITVYAKNDQSDLSAADRRAITRIIELIEQQLEQEVIK